MKSMRVLKFFVFGVYGIDIKIFLGIMTRIIGNLKFLLLSNDHSWGPNVKKLAGITKHLEGQGVAFEQAPMVSENFIKFSAISSIIYLYNMRVYMFRYLLLSWICASFTK